MLGKNHSFIHVVLTAKVNKKLKKQIESSIFHDKKRVLHLNFMELVIDSGNTFSKAGWFENNQLVRSVYGLKFDELAQWVKKYPAQRAIISTVSIQIDDFVRQLQLNIPFLHLTNKTPLPIGVDYDTPTTLGVDRLAAAVGANYLYPKRNLMVIDAGTCITYDLIDQAGVFQGGAIAPGMRMRFKAMHLLTSRLPLVEDYDAKLLIGKSTQSAMQSGVVNGMLAEITGMAQAYGEKYPQLEIVMCGGDLQFFESRVKLPIFAVPELVLVGLNRILQYNDI